MSEEFRSLGPLIAIGKPDDALPAIGSGRFYVDDDQWQAALLEVMSASQLVVLICGATQGLRWELQQVIQRLDPSELLLCIPRQRHSRDTRLAEWRQFTTTRPGSFHSPCPMMWARPSSSVLTRNGARCWWARGQVHWLAAKRCDAPFSGE